MDDAEAELFARKMRKSLFLITIILRVLLAGSLVLAFLYAKGLAWIPWLQPWDRPGVGAFAATLSAGLVACALSAALLLPHAFDFVRVRLNRLRLALETRIVLAGGSLPPPRRPDLAPVAVGAHAIFGFCAILTFMRIEGNVSLLLLLLPVHAHIAWGVYKLPRGDVGLLRLWRAAQAA